jgi:hypothetical protein
MSIDEFQLRQISGIITCVLLCPFVFTLNNIEINNGSKTVLLCCVWITIFVFCNAILQEFKPEAPAIRKETQALIFKPEAPAIRKETQALISHRPSRSEISYSNPRNNHDHLKYKHTTLASAEREVRRMQNAGYEGSHRLNAYCNEQLDGYFVGKGWDF